MVYTVDDIEEEMKCFLIPKELFENICFSSLSTNAKILYGLMLDRLFSVVETNPSDKVKNTPYILFPIDEIKTILRVSKVTAIKTKKELLAVGLISVKKSLYKEDIIFVNEVAEILKQKGGQDEKI